MSVPSLFAKKGEAMSDLIKREDAIEAVKRVSENYTGKGKRDYHPHVDFIIDELKYCVSSADRPQGEWISKGKRIYRCSNCGNYLDFDGVNAGRGDANYCPNCGAKMKGEDNE